MSGDCFKNITRFYNINFQSKYLLYCEAAEWMVNTFERLNDDLVCWYLAVFLYPSITTQLGRRVGKTRCSVCSTELQPPLYTALLSAHWLQHFTWAEIKCSLSSGVSPISLCLCPSIIFESHSSRGRLGSVLCFCRGFVITLSILTFIDIV